MAETIAAEAGTEARRGPLIYRQRLTTRLTHWLWALALFFLLLSGLQILMARPDLYIGQQSGFAFDNTVFSIGAVREAGELRGQTTLFGETFDTTGWLGVVTENGQTQVKSFPGWMTVPGYRDLATGRVVHFFFAWILVATLSLWLAASLFNGHIRQLIPTLRDVKHLPRDAADHLRLRFHRSADYNVLQKLSYGIILLIVLPLMILTGLTMSPGVNAAAPWVLDLFGGRQSARTLHFAGMLLLVLFVSVHLLMVLMAGPFNELRSIVTGWYRTDPRKDTKGDAAR